MTNREKYADKIKNYQGENFCIDFIQPKVLGQKDCTGHGCPQCKMLQMIWLDEEYVEEEPEVDWSKVAVDTPILVSTIDDPDTEWLKRYFAKYENGKVYAFNYGATSWSESCGVPADWNYAKLAENKS